MAIGRPYTIEWEKLGEEFVEYVKKNKDCLILETYWVLETDITPEDASGEVHRHPDSPFAKLYRKAKAIIKARRDQKVNDGTMREGPYNRMIWLWHPEVVKHEKELEIEIHTAKADATEKAKKKHGTGGDKFYVAKMTQFPDQPE